MRCNHKTIFILSNSNKYLYLSCSISKFRFLPFLKIFFCEFQVATRIMKQIIDQFALFDIFGRDNYEYYARVTGRVLRVQDEWICSFRYPAPPRGKSRHISKSLYWTRCVHFINSLPSLNSTIIIGNGKNLVTMSMWSMGVKLVLYFNFVALGCLD